MATKPKIISCALYDLEALEDDDIQKLEKKSDLAVFQHADGFVIVVPHTEYLINSLCRKLELSDPLEQILHDARKAEIPIVMFDSYGM